MQAAKMPRQTDHQRRKSLRVNKPEAASQQTDYGQHESQVDSSQDVSAYVICLLRTLVSRVPLTEMVSAIWMASA